MAPIAGRPCLYQDEGCNCQTPECNVITTVNETEMYVNSHSGKCIHNPVVAEEKQHRRELEAADLARRVVAEAAETACRVAVDERQERAEADERRQL